MPKQDIRERFRAYYNRYTLAPQFGCEEDCDKQLKELDENLHLRRSTLYDHWAIYYDFHGKLSVITTVDNLSKFPLIMRSLRKNSCTTKRDLMFMYLAQQDQHAQEVKDRILDAGYEAGHYIHHWTRGLVFSTPKAN